MTTTLLALPMTKVDQELHLKSSERTMMEMVRMLRLLRELLGYATSTALVTAVIHTLRRLADRDTSLTTVIVLLLILLRVLAHAANMIVGEVSIAITKM